MPAAHRAVDKRFMNRDDIPVLIAYIVQVLIIVLALWLGAGILDIPLLSAALLLGMCYGAFLIGWGIRKISMAFLTPTTDERRDTAEQTLHDETTIDMPWSPPPPTRPNLMPPTEEKFT